MHAHLRGSFFSFIVHMYDELKTQPLGLQLVQTNTFRFVGGNFKLRKLGVQVEQGEKGTYCEQH